MTLRCFVAMAFGRSDSDRVYNLWIKKAIKENGITPIRIDKKQHNNNIDDEMIKELEKADLIISDLTYARPSVYFEAGFGEGFSKGSEKISKPVIYTSRKDHLSGKKDDEFGNFKIHFDLQMKNIIPWINENDRIFFTDLKNRIRHVVKPLMKDVNVDKKLQKKVFIFNYLSSQDKIKKILEVGSKNFRKIGYDGILIGNRDGSPIGIDYPYSARGDQLKLRINYPTSGMYQNKMKPNLLNPTWIGTKFKDNCKNVIFFHVTPNLTKSIITYLDQALLSAPTYNLSPPSKNTVIKLLVENLIICSFGKVNSKKIMEYFTDFKYDVKGDDFFCTYKQLVPIKKLDLWKEIFYNNQNRFQALMRKTSNGHLNEDLRIKDSFLIQNYFNRKKWVHMDRKITKVRFIPRHIRITILDGIKSDEHFKISLEKHIKYMEQ